MTYSWIADEDLVVVHDARALRRLLAIGEPVGLVAARFAGRWYLLDGEDTELLHNRVERGETLRDVMVLLSPVVVRGSKGGMPGRPTLVLRGARVRGAWVPQASAAAFAEGFDASFDLEALPPLVQDIPISYRARPGSARPGSQPAGRTRKTPPKKPRRRSAGAASARPPVQSIRQTPHIDAPKRIRKKPGTTFTVTIYADTSDLREGETGELTISAPRGVDRVDAGVLLQVTKHFEVLSDREYGTLSVATDGSESSRVEFKLGVVSDPPGGLAVISALFTLRGRSCGQAARSWNWDGPAATAGPVAPDTAAPTSVPMHVADRADLSIFVTSLVNDGVNYVCAVETPRLDGYSQASTSEPFAVPPGGHGFLKKLLQDLTDEGKTPKQRLRALREVGQSAWDAAPTIVKTVLWAMVDAGCPPATLNVASVEPLLPWELMIPRRYDGKQPRRLEPLGIGCAVGRWTRGDGQGPPPRLPVKNAFIVAPVYSGQDQLDATAEIDFITDRLGGEVIEEASVEALDERFLTDHASLLHFVCHGDAGVEDDDVILLDHGEPLRARTMEALDGFDALCQAAAPLVFLNSCSTGRMVPSLSGGAGFPRSFANLGAHAIIAPLWPVDDAMAHEIAVEIYSRALPPDPQPIASILRDIRKRGYENEDADTYAAYCFFGDPLARIEPV